MKKGVSTALNVLGVITIIIGFAAGIVICVNTKSTEVYGTYYSFTIEEWSAIGLAWMAVTWLGSIIAGAVLMWMSEMLDEQRAQTLFLEKICQTVNPNRKINELDVGDKVYHSEFGTGKIEGITEDGEIKIKFEKYGTAFLAQSEAKEKLKKI